MLPFMDRGHPLVSAQLSNLIAVAALLFSVWARLSLGRNMGFVPAQREIVTTGAYRYVRHPIYRIDLELSGRCAANLRPAQCHALSDRRFLDARQELRRGKLSPCRRTIRRLHDESTRALDSPCHLILEQKESAHRGAPPVEREVSSEDRRTSTADVPCC